MRTVVHGHVNPPVVKSFLGRVLDGDGHKYIYQGDHPQL